MARAQRGNGFAPPSIWTEPLESAEATFERKLLVVFGRFEDALLEFSERHTEVLRQATSQLDLAGEALNALLRNERQNLSPSVQSALVAVNHWEDALREKIGAELFAGLREVYRDHSPAEAARMTRARIQLLLDSTTDPVKLEYPRSVGRISLALVCVRLLKPFRSITVPFGKIARFHTELRISRFIAKLSNGARFKKRRDLRHCRKTWRAVLLGLRSTVNGLAEAARRPDADALICHHVEVVLDNIRSAQRELERVAEEGRTFCQTVRRETGRALRQAIWNIQQDSRVSMEWRNRIYFRLRNRLRMLQLPQSYREVR